MKVRIITDDFTSALDGTAYFAERGWDSAVLLDPDSDTDAAVVSLDTDTRETLADYQPERVAHAAHSWRDADYLAVQFDSTLRGHVAIDCLAAWHASGRPKLLLVPAFPAAGRTVRLGCVRVDGIPVAQTAFGRDPTHPVRESSLLALFASHGVPVFAARDPQQAQQLLQLHDAVVVDAESEEALDAIVRAFAHRRDVLWAGSTGLMRALARQLPCPSAQASAPSLPPVRRPLVAVGSMNPRSRAQLAYLQQLGVPSVLASSAQRQDPAQALAGLVDEAVALLRRGEADALIATGGETARRIIDCLPVTSLQLLGEVMPGVPLARVNTRDGAFALVTKAGGFGDETALHVCLSVLKGGEA